MSDRVKNHRKRMKEAGWKQSAIWLPPQAVIILSDLCNARNLTRQEVITCLIMEAADQVPSAVVRPVSKKKPVRKKAAALKKKATRKKKKTSKRQPTVELDAIGLERSVGYEDWEAAVSIRIDRGVNNANGEHVDWDHGMIRHSYMWDSEVEVASFKKKHKKAISVEASYPQHHKRSIVYRAHYPVGVKDHRIVLGALPAKSKKRN